MRTFRRIFVVLGFVSALFASWWFVLASESSNAPQPQPAAAAGLSDPLYVGFVSTNVMTPDLFATIDTTTGLFNAPAIAVGPVGGGPFDVTVNLSGSEAWLAGSTGDGVVVFDRSGQFIVQPIANVGDWPSDVIFSKNHDLVYVPVRRDDTIVVIDPSTYTIIDSYDVSSFGNAGFEPGKGAVQPCSGDIYIVDYFAPYLFHVDEQSGALLGEIEAGNSLWDAVFSPDGATLYVTDRSFQSDELIVVDTASFTVTNRIGVGDNPWGVAITPDGSKVMTANETDGTVTIIDTALELVIATIPLGPQAAPRDIDVSADGSRAYVPSGDQSSFADVVYVIDLTTNTLAGSFALNGIDKPVIVASSPDSSSLDPVASFSSNSPVANPTVPMTFMDTSSNTPTSWAWDFGDGLGTSTLQNPTYAYANVGQYAVTMTATNVCGSHTITQTVQVGIDQYLPIVANP